MAEVHKSLEVLTFKAQSEFLEWLDANYLNESGYWLKLAKKKSDKQTITYEEAREVAIMYGWIDGLINSYDEDYYLIRFSHRRKKSVWSKINVGIATQLMIDGKMQTEGQKEADAAKADGRWDKAY